MKKNEVPQHEGNLLNGIKEIQYAIDEDGIYTQVKSTGWEPKNEALKQALDLLDAQIEEARQDVLTGEKSPIWFYMHLKQMDFTILKQTTGFRKFKIKKHCNASQFKKLKEPVLQKYADAFNIDIQQLSKVPEERIHSLEYNFNFKQED
jgi:hypothetical protein